MMINIRLTFIIVYHLDRNDIKIYLINAASKSQSESKNKYVSDP